MPGALIFLLSALKKIKLNLGIEKDMASVGHVPIWPTAAYMAYPLFIRKNLDPPFCF